MPVGRAIVLRPLQSNEPPEARHVNQLVHLVNGDTGSPVRLTRWDSSTSHSLAVKNTSSNASAPIAVFRDDTDAVKLEVRKDGVTAGAMTASGGLLVYPSLTVRDSAVGTAQLNVSTTEVITYPAFRAQRADGTTMIQVTSAGGKVLFDLGVTVNGTSTFAAAVTFSSGTTFTGTATFNGDANFNGTTTISGMKRTAVGTYTGDGTDGAGRSITTGWQPRLVIIAGGTSNATVEVYHVFDNTGAAKNVNAGNVEYTTNVHLLTNGFRVADGAVVANTTGQDYRWVAWEN